MYLLTNKYHPGSAMPSQPTRTDRVRCLHCRKAQVIHSRRGLHFTCKHCGKPNPGPAISEAVLAPIRRSNRDAAPAPAVGEEQREAAEAAGAQASASPAKGSPAAPPKRAAKVVRRSGAGAANRPPKPAGGEPGAAQGQPAAPPPAASQKESGPWSRFVWGG